MGLKNQIADEMMPYEQLKKRLLSIPDRKEQALLCTIYGAMARVGEIVIGRYKKTRPLFGSDVFSYINKIEIHIPRTEKTGRPRKVPLFRNREAWLIRPIEEYARAIGPAPMFPHSTRWAELVFRKYFPEFRSNRSGDPNGSKHTIHWLRGWRYTHYRRGDVTGRPVEARIVALLGGWINSSTPERHYDFTRIEDFEDILEGSNDDTGQYTGFSE